MNEPNGFQLLKVLGDGGPAEGQTVGDIPRYARLRFSKVLQDGQPGGVRDYPGKLCQFLQGFFKFFRFIHFL